MVAPTIENDKPKVGRNQDCPCGSGKKWKYCCGGNGELVPDQKKILNQVGLNRCFLKLVKDAGGSLDITCEEIEAMPKDEMLGIKYDGKDDLFHFKVMKVKVSPIIQPGSKLRH